MQATPTTGAMNDGGESTDPVSGEAAEPLPVATETASIADALDPDAVVLSLKSTLAIASRNSRDYQSRKESLYLSALSLTSERHRFNPLFFAGASGDYTALNSGETNTVSADTDFGFSWLLATGARLSVSLASSFSQSVSGDPLKAAQSFFQVNISQPLLQGAGITVTESLTQADRNVVYEMRSFVRFRRTFFVSVLSEYYRVLQRRQVLENEELNYERLKLSRERSEELFNAGRLPGYQLDQVRQDELRASNSLERAIQQYRSSLDRIKITLGLPADAQIVLDPGELDRLAIAEDEQTNLDPDRCAEIATANRLDLLTVCDQVEDASRKVQVARNDLLPGLDLSASYDVDTPGDANEPLNFREETSDLSVGFDLELPLDQLNDRNEYRRRLITLDRAERSYAEEHDLVVLEVRDALRDYDLARRTHGIQAESLRLAESRVDNTVMLLEAGRADTREMLDARRDLLDAQNSLAQAIVDYVVARLSLARDMGILVVDEDGGLKENFEAYE
jgi:outer membrane protein TolC